MKLIIKTIIYLISIIIFTCSCKARTSAIESQMADTAYLKSNNIQFTGKLIDAQQFSDKKGNHILVLSRKSGPSPTDKRSGRIEHIDLHVEYYSQQSNGWKQDWKIYDFVECPGLDASADFFSSLVSITDINNNGEAEITIPYKTFCGGGIDSANIKVILREGTLKLAIRGESLVEIPGQEPFGGQFHYDNDLLLPTYLSYKKHMYAIWKAVERDQRK
jgi:hypothetical protein